MFYYLEIILKKSNLLLILFLIFFRFKVLSNSLYVQSPTSIGLFVSKTASLYVPFFIASTVFFVEPVNLAI